MLRVTLAGMVGTTLEFYDHFIYGSAAALIFPRVFFSQMSPNLALLLSLVTYGVAFLARPLGAVIFGHFGDRIGRRDVLVVALVLMGASTFLIGCLPDYATAGATGAYLLCVLRVLQGIALGGEWGGATLMVSEYAKGSKIKALLGSIVQMASPLGFLLAGGMFAAVTSLTTEAQLLDWGWRIPFLLSALLVGVGVYMRLHLAESPEFLQMQKKEPVAPVLEVARNHLKPVLLAVGTRTGSDIAFYVFALFPLVYLPHLGLPRESALVVGMAAAVGQMCGIPLFGYLSDRHGTKRVLAVGAVLNIVWCFAYVYLLDTMQMPWIIAGAFVALFLLAALWAPLAAHLPALFPVSVRYTGTGLGFQAAGILGGALAPTICLMLLNRFDSGYAVALYLGATLLVALWCTVKTELRYS